MLAKSIKKSNYSIKYLHKERLKYKIKPNKIHFLQIAAW